MAGCFASGVLLMKDKKIMLWGIPIVTIFLALYFGSEELYASFKMFATKIGIISLYTSSVWIGNSYLMKYWHSRYPKFEQTKTRLLYTSISSILYTISIYTLLTYLVCHLIRETFTYELYFEDLKKTFLITGIVMIYYESVFFFNRWKTTHLYAETLKKESMQAQLESLKNQVNPHFLFNSLNTLASIIPDNSELAIRFVQNLSAVYRYLLSVQKSELVYLAQELEFVKSYSFLLETRFGKSIDISINIDNKYLDWYLPPVSLQLLLENAIKHNVVSIANPLKIAIFSKEDYLTVENNFQEKQEKEVSTGIGLQNIKNRYAMLSEKVPVIECNSETFIVKLPLLYLAK